LASGIVGLAGDPVTSLKQGMVGGRVLARLDLGLHLFGGKIGRNAVLRVRRVERVGLYQIPLIRTRGPIGAVRWT
jgi:hypothetical protein